MSIKLSKAEQAAIDFLDGHSQFGNTTRIDRSTVKRRSEQPFDIEFSGTVEMKPLPRQTITVIQARIVSPDAKPSAEPLKETKMEVGGGTEPTIAKMSAWLPLALIRASNWPKFSGLSDYPDMVAAGDWSGIRDSSKETIFEILPYALRDLKLSLT